MWRFYWCHPSKKSYCFQIYNLSILWCSVWWFNTVFFFFFNKKALSYVYNFDTYVLFAAACIPRLILYPTRVYKYYCSIHSIKSIQMLGKKSEISTGLFLVETEFSRWLGRFWFIFKRCYIFSCMQRRYNKQLYVASTWSRALFYNRFQWSRSKCS